MRRIRSAVLGLTLVASVGLGLAACGDKGDDGAIPADPQVAAGKTLVSNSCSGCHSTDGSRRAGPSFKNLAGSQVQLDGGSTVTADDTYLKVAIQDPDAQIAKGFNKGIMSSAVKKGQYNDEQTAQIIAYLKTVK